MGALMPDAVLVLDAVTKRYDGHVAVRGMTFSVPAGSIYGLLGPNGAGKTTTIKILMNLLQPGSGRAEVLGRDSTKLGWRDFQRIGYVSENQVMPDDMKVGELLDY